MKTILILLLAAAPVSAQFRTPPPSEDKIPGIVKEIPVFELMQRRQEASVSFKAGGKDFFATISFDDDWNTWFELRPADSLNGAGSWSLEKLSAGVLWKTGNLEVRIRVNEGVARIEADGDRVEIQLSSIFDALYYKSDTVTFGDIVTYAVIRNQAPMSGRGGTVTLRQDSDGAYYFSVTWDKDIISKARWFVAVNGVIYGLKLDGSIMRFLSEPLNKPVPDLPAEKRLN